MPEGDTSEKWRKVSTGKADNEMYLPNRFVEYRASWSELSERCRDWRSMEPSEWAKKYR